MSFVDGRELNNGIDSLRWDGDLLIAEIPVDIFGTIEPEPTTVSIQVPTEPMVRSGALTFAWPKPSLWTRLVCSLWFGHRPNHYDPLRCGFAADMLTCRCGKVTDSAENVIRLTAR